MAYDEPTLKDLEGQTVYLRPTGNNARRGGEELFKAKIIKVAQVFCTFAIDGRREEKYVFEGFYLHDCNAGYIVYKSLQSLLDFYKCVKLARLISDRCMYPHILQKSNLSILERMADILGLDTDDV